MLSFSGNSRMLPSMWKEIGETCLCRSTCFAEGSKKHLLTQTDNQL